MVSKQGLDPGEYDFWEGGVCGVLEFEKSSDVNLGIYINTNGNFVYTMVSLLY